jgi:hypothetical protein
MAASLRKWSIEERDTALLTVAACGGNSAKASAMLKQQGISIQPRALRMWRESQFAERYIELASEHGRAIEKVAEVKMRETII